MCSRTRHQTLLWKRHLSATQETSSEQAAGPSLLFGSNPSHKYLWSCQNLKEKTNRGWGVRSMAFIVCVSERALLRVPFLSYRQHVNSTYLRSSQWSPRRPCSSEPPDLGEQICWRLGRPCRLRFPLPSVSSFSEVAGPGWWSSGRKKEKGKMPKVIFYITPDNNISQLSHFCRYMVARLQFSNGEGRCCISSGWTAC